METAQLMEQGRMRRRVPGTHAVAGARVGREAVWVATPARRSSVCSGHFYYVLQHVQRCLVCTCVTV